MNVLDVVCFFPNISLCCVHSEKNLIESSLSLMICQQICSEKPVSGRLYPNHHCALSYAQPLLYINLEYHLESLSSVFSLLPLLWWKVQQTGYSASFLLSLLLLSLFVLSLFFLFYFSFCPPCSISIYPAIFPYLTTPYFRYIYLHLHKNAPCSLQIPPLMGDVYSPLHDHVPTDSPIPLLWM